MRSRKKESSSQESSCTLCPYKSTDETDFNRHLLKSHRIILKRRLIDYKLKNKQTEYRAAFQCEKCFKHFALAPRLEQHKIECDKLMPRPLQAYETVCCQLCPFKAPATQMTSLQNHIWRVHSLICKPVKEADFLQAMTRTPYTLERVPVVDSLPTMSERKAKKLMTCWKCDTKFTKSKQFSHHMKRINCTGTLM